MVCNFNPENFLSIVKQHHRFDPYKKCVFTPNVTSFAIERSSFLKIHGTSPSLKDKEGPASPLVSFIGQCLFLVFEATTSLLTAIVSLLFHYVCLHKEDEIFFNISMGSRK
jgi:hypothetical protein